MSHKAQGLFHRMKVAMQHFVTAYKGIQVLVLARSMRQWRHSSWVLTAAHKYELSVQAAEETSKQELARKDRVLAGLEQKLQTSVTELGHIKASDKALRQSLKENEGKEQALLEALHRCKLKTRDDKSLPKKADERIQVLEGQVASLEQVNQKLKERLDSTENGVGSFVNEMNEMLDSHEFSCIHPADI